MSVPAMQSDVATRHDLMEQLALARRRTDELFAIVKPDSLYERPIGERHRVVFYIGHLEAFDWNLFRGRVFDVKSFHPDFDRLFAFGIDPVGGGLPNDQPSDWPSITAVREYVDRVRNILDDELASALAGSLAGLGDRIFDGFPLSTLINVAIEHRLMHAETLAYMFHQLPLDRKIFQRESLNLAASSSPSHRSIEIPAGSITLGLPRCSGLFGWDNEFEAHTVDVPGLAIDRYKVTNRQYLDFMEAGGYENCEFWIHNGDDQDWTWKSQQEIQHPAFWKRDGEQWLYRTMFEEISFEEISLAPDWPVYVSHAEAQAYARWAQKRLPSEAEWQRAAYATPSGEEQHYPWGNKAPSANLGNFDFVNWSPTPVNAYPHNQSAFGVHDMLGNGWEWTSTKFASFPGFEPFPFYRGYSADFFDGRHFVMKGGSSRTAACMLRRSFRNWFQPHYQYMYAGFRCVSRSSSGNESSTDN
ncbi:MAG: SUMF1/EgtB/PvdO family nonheme iron enzyme [Candidatus Sulfotelmatobacter sp.]